MTWLQRFRFAHYVQNSIWIWPLASMFAALVLIRVLHPLEESLGWVSDISPDASRAVVGTLASAMFTFVVFVSSALLVAVQLASSQLTPRIIAIVFRDPATKICLTVFVFTFTFSLGALVRIGDVVPALTTNIAAYSSVVSLGVFVYLIDHVGKTLRPSGALWNVAWLGRQVIESVYPRHLGASQELPLEASDIPAQQPSRTVVSPKDGVVLAFDLPGLVALAKDADCVIELAPQVGDFVAIGDPLFRVYGRGAKLRDNQLVHSVAVGQERTLEQDPLFAIRIIVDIANKGLSPAINDPTTAVLALDQLHHLLRDLGRRCLDDERVFDGTGTVRLIYRTPGWDDFVHLAVTEIRQFGGSSIQIVRRLRAMLENLIETLPEERRSLLRQELTLVQRTADRCFVESEDRAFAEVSDSQGVGGNPGRSRSDPTT